MTTTTSRKTTTTTSRKTSSKRASSKTTSKTTSASMALVVAGPRLVKDVIRTPIKQVDPVAVSAARVDSIILKFGDDSAELHSALCDLFNVLSAMKKSDIKRSEALNALFSRRFYGIDKRRLVSWVHSYFPIRLMFKQNGHFDQIGWSGSHAKTHGWKIEEASIDRWFTHEPEKKSLKPKAVSSVSPAVKALAQLIAKRGYELGSVSKAKEEALESLKSLDSLILQYQESDAYEKWAAART